MARKTVSEVMADFGACDWWVKFTKRYGRDARQAIRSARMLVALEQGSSREVSEDLCMYVVQKAWRTYNNESWFKYGSNCIHMTNLLDADGFHAPYPDEMIDDLVVEIYERLSRRE